ncbi:hypothetical protein D9757_007466 [Collybiopsis confluens]|uniref:Uncharacterized protein n=1 Tax=Collybiopsis confluens TaxID=2823264 RepID=A0A8H5HJT5_9AGAR|nr:hypothetical protein D9757_007466 [Collybiopsis confluens]
MESSIWSFPSFLPRSLHNWVGHLTFLPSAQLSNASTTTDITVYTWWNGATEVRFWQLLGSNLTSASAPLNVTDLQLTMPTTVKLGDPVGKVDFETSLHYNGNQGHFVFYQVAALDGIHRILGHSNIISLSNSTGSIAYYQ